MLPDIVARYARTGVHLAGKTTWGVGGIAENFIELADERIAELVVMSLLRDGIKFFVLGGGSNVLINDGIITDPIISLAGMNHISFSVRGDVVMLECGAGAGVGRAVSESVDMGAIELAPLAGIPGTAAGAVVGNAGTQIGSIGDALESVRVVCAEGIKEIFAKDLRMAYRTSRFSDQCGEVIISASMRLTKHGKEEASAAVRSAAATRRSQPLSAKTAGCVFKNPVGDSAGRLLDAAGCKGMSEGGARVSSVHANFIENHDGATARDIVRLIDRCRREVRLRFGVQLMPEVKGIGFDEPL